MSKGLITFIVIACIAVVTAVAIKMMISANEARNRSDEIMEQFKTVDKGLQRTTEELDSLNKIYFDSLRKADK
jgi:hypothetical protein